MIAHTSIPVGNYKRAKAFYAKVLATLGYKQNMEYGEAAGFNQDGQVLSAAKVARRASDALGEACLRTVALAWLDGEVLLTVLVTEHRGGECTYPLTA